MTSKKCMNYVQASTMSANAWHVKSAIYVAPAWALETHHYAFVGPLVEALVAPWSLPMISGDVGVFPNHP